MPLEHNLNTWRLFLQTNYTVATVDPAVKLLSLIQFTLINYLYLFIHFIMIFSKTFIESQFVFLIKFFKYGSL